MIYETTAERRCGVGRPAEGLSPERLAARALVGRCRLYADSLQCLRLALSRCRGSRGLAAAAGRSARRRCHPSVDIQRTQP